MPRTPEGGLRRLALAVPRWAVDYAASGWMHVLEPFFPDVPEEVRAHGSREQDIVLLPGVYQTWVAMHALAARLSAIGFRVHAIPELGHNRMTIGRSAKTVRRVLDAAGMEQVYLVAHSKGGLIGKRLLVDQRKADRRRRADPEAPPPGPRLIGMTALSTPFHGSSYAPFMLSPALRRFQPGDRAIRKLDDNDRVNAMIASIYGRFDPHIPEGSELPGAAVNIEVPTVGHMQVLRDGLTLAIAQRTVDAECRRLSVAVAA